MNQFGFAFAAPAWFGLSLLLPLVVWGRWRARPGLPGVKPPGGSGRALPRSWRQRLAWLPPTCLAVGLGCLIAALARPTQRLPLPPERLGVDLLLCVDTSSSMAATDLGDAEQRLAAARRFAASFGAGRPADRLGCVRFARFADLVCPPTLDHAAFATLLERLQLVLADGPEDATGIGAALAVGAEVLQRSSSKSKVIVLLTDGEENLATTASPQEIAPLHAAQWCRQLGVRVHTVVVGKGSPQPDGSFLPLDLATVQQVAATTGGRCYTAPDAVTLAAVQRAIEDLEKVPFAEPRVLVREWFALPLWLGLVLGWLGRWLGQRRLEVLT